MVLKESQLEQQSLEDTAQKAGDQETADRPLFLVAEAHAQAAAFPAQHQLPNCPQTEAPACAALVKAHLRRPFQSTAPGKRQSHQPGPHLRTSGHDDAPERRRHEGQSKERERKSNNSKQMAAMVNKQ